jgi:dipeptidyl aminopeptidase/acylaminoacyl peptidase
MKTKFVSIARSSTVILILILAPLALAQTKRPLTHRDYDGWRNIQNETLSDDGKFLAYGLFPQEGDGEVVVRNLQTGAEWRQPAGARPAPRAPNPETEEASPIPNIKIFFTSDSRFVVFSVFPSQAARDKAKKAKLKPEEAPKDGMVILDLATGSAVRIDRVKNFQVPETGNGLFAYLREPDLPKPPASKAPDAEAKTANEPDEAGAASHSEKKEYGSVLMLRNLAAQTERTFPDVLDYTLSKDAATLVYAVASRKEDADGLFVVEAGHDSTPRPLLAGPGKYSHLTWDFDQSQLAFLSDRDDAKSKQPKFILYLWPRNSDAAPISLVSAATPGFRDGFVVSDKGAVTFSHDGKRIFFGCAPPPPAEDPLADMPAEDKVNTDFWSWKDEHIQPMQKLQAEREKNRTYRAVYHLPEKKMVQLADASMAEVTPSEDGLWALGADARAYGPVAEYDADYNDYYLVDPLTGNRHLLLSKQMEAPDWSPDAKHLLYFAGKDWMTISVPDGKIANLTANRGVNFWREDYDSPAPPPSYGTAGWTKDGKYVLLYDQYDVWRMTPDGGEGVNLTRGAGRAAHLEFRHVRLGSSVPDPEARWIDPSQPLLLHAEDQETFDSGFYRTRIDATEPPRKLLFASKAFTTPLKAQNADVLVFAASTFEEFPDLLSTDTNFAKLQKVTDANPQQSQFIWGTAELIHYRNADGVPLKGILYKPENFDPSKKYPMLIYLYEKLSQNIHSYQPPRPNTTIVPTFYVSNGYLVLEPDIVYTIGYPGQSALKCVLAAIDSIVARGYVNEKAIGIEGHSWGGYQIAYMLTQTNRFRAAEAGAPVSDMISSYDGIRWGTGIPRQFQYERTQSRIGGSLWESPLKFIDNSPIFMAERVTTPLLILHNDADTAVPWYQGIEYFLALRRLGKEVYMFTYNGEPHGLARRPDQKDFTVRMQQFFDYYLKGAPEPDWMIHGIPYLDRDTEKERLKKQTGVY